MTPSRRVTKAVFRSAMTTALGLGIIAQSGCFYFTRDFLRRVDERTVTTAECRTALTDTGGDLYLRFTPDDFAAIAETRPWLRNPLALHFTHREAASDIARTSQAVIYAGPGREPAAGIIAWIDGSELSESSLLEPGITLAETPARTFIVHVMNRRYTQNPLRYGAAPLFVLGDVVVNIITFGFVGGYGCAKQDSDDRMRSHELDLESALAPRHRD